MFNLNNLFLLLLLILFLCRYLPSYYVPSYKEKFTSEKDLIKCLHNHPFDGASIDSGKKCYNKYLDITNRDIKEFKKCLISSGYNYNTITKCMPELAVSNRQINTPSSASGDFNVTSDMYNLVSNIAPQNIARGLGKETFGNRHSTPNEGFINNSYEQMNDSNRSCFRKYGTSGWQSFGQCVQSGEGMVK